MAAVSQLVRVCVLVGVIACDTRPRTVVRTDASSQPAETLITRIPRLVRHASAMQRATGRVTPARAFAPLDSPLVIRVFDQRGAELRGADVRWTLKNAADGAQLKVLNAKTDSLGLSRATFTPGPSASGQGPVAEVVNVGRIDFGIAVPPASIRVVAEPVLWSGDRQVARAVLRDSAGVELHGGALSWGTSDTSVLRVESVDSLRASVTGLLAGSAILYAWIGPGTPRGGAQVNVIPVFAGRFVTIDGRSPPPMTLELRVGSRRDSVHVEQGTFTKRVEIFPHADVEIAATPATSPGAELYHPVRMRQLSQRQLQDLRIALVPTSWRVDAGTYQGQTLPIDAEVAMRRASSGAPFWRLAPVSGLGPRTIAGWRESDLPLHVAFDRGRSTEIIAATDSVAFWGIAARMERDLGLSLFTPAEMRDDTSRSNFVRVEISSQVADGHTFVSWSSAGDVRDGVVQFRHAATLRDPHVVTHELLHLLGFGHTSAWTTVALPSGGREQGLTAQDVAYVQLAMRLRRLQRETGAVPGLPIAIQ